MYVINLARHPYFDIFPTSKLLELGRFLWNEEKLLNDFPKCSRTLKRLKGLFSRHYLCAD